MDTLPNEITSRVLSFLPVADRLRCSIVSRAWRRLTPSFWGVAADVLEHLNSFNACACSAKLTFKGCNSCGEEAPNDWLWLGDKEEADRDKSNDGFLFIRSDPRRRPTYPLDVSNLSDFSSMHGKYHKSNTEYSRFVQTIMPTSACSVSIAGSAASILEISQRQRFMLIFKFTVAAVIRLSNHYIGRIRDILNGRGGVMFPGGVYPKMDAFLSASPIRYEVIYHICALNMATDELFGAYDMYHFRRDYRRSDGRVCIDDEGNGSSFYDELDYYMCGIFGFQGYNPSGEIDPYMKPNVAAPLFGVEPGSSVHVDYILNRRGE